MITVVALGGHALAAPGEAPGAGTRARVEEVAGHVAAHLAAGALLVTHGNGPLAGWLVAQAEAALGPHLGLDAVTAQTEGLTGYQLEIALGNALPGREIATLLTRVEVDPKDPALARPSKPIGRAYDDEEADCLRARGFPVGRDARGYRRLVASPQPLRVLEERAIARLLEPDGIVVCGGGGGIPVQRLPDGRLAGVDAIVDKDATSGLLACALGAERLLLLTDVAGVHPAWPDEGTVLRSADPEAIAARSFGAGDMGPKVAAAVRFARETGGTARIGRADDLAALLAGEAGTRVERGAPWREVPAC